MNLPVTHREYIALAVRAGKDEPGVSAAVIDRAASALGQIFSFGVELSIEVKAPHVSVGFADEVNMRWWCGNRTLSLYVLPDGLEWIQILHQDPENRRVLVEGMDDIAISDFAAKWAWLQNAEERTP